MSLMIKGMNMPKSCKDCPCREYPKFSFESNWCCLNQKTISDVRVISPNYPLIEVPTPHRRLIDAEKLAVKIWTEGHFVTGNDCEIAVDFTQSAPTIIEAEASE